VREPSGVCLLPTGGVGVGVGGGLVAQRLIADRDGPTLSRDEGLHLALSVTAPVFRCGPDWPERPLRVLGEGAARIGVLSGAAS
jgi:hypothetical protein